MTDYDDDDVDNQNHRWSTDHSLSTNKNTRHLKSVGLSDDDHKDNAGDNSMSMSSRHCHHSHTHKGSHGGISPVFSSSSPLIYTVIKVSLSIGFCLSAFSTLYQKRFLSHTHNHTSSFSVSFPNRTSMYQKQQLPVQQQQQQQHKHRKLSSLTQGLDVDSSSLASSSSSSSSHVSYMEPLFQDLKKRQSLFDTTPPEEIKYWFEYTGTLQKYFYRYSKSRKKADYFEGRDDSGVVSSRFYSNLGGGFMNPTTTTTTTTEKDTNHNHQVNIHPNTFLEYCFKMGSTPRPTNRSFGSLWYQFYASTQDKTEENAQEEEEDLQDRCRILVVINTIGAGKGSTILWETQPPIQPHGNGPEPWISEQDTASTHLQRNLQEINTLCATQLMAVRIQVLVCEPIPTIWVDWMDSLVPDCGGQSAPYTDTTTTNPQSTDSTSTLLEDRPSPIQVVVVATASTASTCHDLKSGFMEQRLQDLILAPPYLQNINKTTTRFTSTTSSSKEHESNNEFKDEKKNKKKNSKQQRLKGSSYTTSKSSSSSNNPKNDKDPTFKGSHEDLVSTEPYDLYIGLKWSSLLTLRSVSAFLQASADIVAAAGSPMMMNQQQPSSITSSSSGSSSSSNVHENLFTSSSIPPSSFLIPSFVRVSYVSEENNKVAKWRMHGDFFHPAAWEICKDSFDMLWLPHSLAGGSTTTTTFATSSFWNQKESIGSSKRVEVDMSSMIPGLCYDKNYKSNMEKRFVLQSSINSTSSHETSSLLDSECGQWWILMTEEQMPTPPEVYGNEKSHPLVQGGSNFFWMLTERQRQEIVKQKICEQDIQLQGNMDAEELDRQCGSIPQAILPLGDLESFLINFSPNTALGKKHLLERSPGYSHAQDRQNDRDIVKERKLLHGQEDIEKALFDYTIYPAALFRKDATLKATRAMDALLTQKKTEKSSNTVSFDANAIQVGPKTIKSSYYDVTITKPRQPVPGWCQAIARKGFCALYSEYFRGSIDIRCSEACGLKKDWSKL